MADWDLGAVVRSFNSGAGDGDQTAPFPPQTHRFAPNDNFPIANPPNYPLAPNFTAFAALGIHPVQHQNAVVFPPPPPTNWLVPRQLPWGYAALRGPRRVHVPASSSSHPRIKRKNQLKIVCTVSKENLYADSWSWRKYGQKPIKGSPFPRNYYRCSGMKGCTARKQMERSTRDPEMFVVTFSGEHAHHRPIHRNSLAGTIRSKSLMYPPPPDTASPAPAIPVTFAAPPPPDTASPAPPSIQYLSSVIERNTTFVYDDVLIPNINISDDIVGDII